MHQGALDDVGLALVQSANRSYFSKKMSQNNVCPTTSTSCWKFTVVLYSLLYKNMFSKTQQLYALPTRHTRVHTGAARVRHSGSVFRRNYFFFFGIYDFPLTKLNCVKSCAWSVLVCIVEFTLTSKIVKGSLVCGWLCNSSKGINKSTLSVCGFFCCRAVLKNTPRTFKEINVGAQESLLRSDRTAQINYSAPAWKFNP